MNSKGALGIRYSIYWTIAVIVLTIVTFALALMISNYTSQLTKQPVELRSMMIAERFGNIEECFAYTNPDSIKIKENSIDLNKFKQENMDDCYKSDSRRGHKTFNFRLQLIGQNQEIITNNYFHADVTELTLFKKVSVWDGTQFINDKMAIYVQEKIGS